MTRNVLIVLVFALVCISAVAQEEPPVVAVTISGGLPFTSNNGNQPSANVAALVSFENYFNRRDGVAINYAFLPSQKFATNGGGVQANGYELTAGYIARFPRRRVTPFVTGGGGVMIYDPSQRYTPRFPIPSAQPRFALLYGAGADIRLHRFIAFRMQYRGLFFPTPNFGTTALDSGQHSHIAEPMVGLVLRF